MLLIFGEVTLSILFPVTGETQQIVEDFKKSICLLGLSNAINNSDKIAKEILAMCPFIDNSMIHNLVEVVEELKLREYDQNGMVVKKETASDGSYLPRFPEIFDSLDDENVLDESSNDEEPDFGKLDHYVDLLYEDIPHKIEGLNCLAKLSKCNSYLKEISRHDSAINAVFQTLREDSKKSSTLTKHILTICLNFARIRDFHELLINQKIPMLILEIVDFELERCEKWKSQLLEIEAHDSVFSARSLNEHQKKLVRLEKLTSVQNVSLKISFQILHCLSEDKGVRETLHENKVIASLGDTLERRDNELLEVVTSFLQNLSSFRQCINEMIRVDLVGQLAALLKEGTPISKKVVNNALHLLYNLSFSCDLREKICDYELISIIVNCFEKSMFREITARILYVLSMDSLIRIKLAKPALLDSLMRCLTTNSDTDTRSFITVVASLVLNLSRTRRGAKMIWETNKLGLLIKSAINQDFFAMKIVRCLAEHDVAFVLYDYAGDIASALINSSDQEFVMECIGILGCIDLQKVSIQSIVQNGKIFPWLKQTLGYYLDKTEIDVSFDLTTASIDVILLLRNLSQVEEGARLVVAEGFVDVLLKISHLGSKTEESVIDHILLFFETCVKHESISVYLATKSCLPNGLLEFAKRTTEKHRGKAISILEQIGKFDETWKENVQELNFLAWNKDWTDAVTASSRSEYDAVSVNGQKFRFQDDSCITSRDAITSLRNYNRTFLL
ncbi:kinesin-associated protein 3 [Folsomia candida]|nr:kinesin-associated protein 3 [Folsomia candida]